MNPLGVFSNNILVAALSAWWLSQSAKVPLTYFKTRRWDWSLLLRISPGG
jgi:acid phosphatase family membrane protein YuiD